MFRCRRSRRRSPARPWRIPHRRNLCGNLPRPVSIGTPGGERHQADVVVAAPGTEEGVGEGDLGHRPGHGRPAVRERAARGDRRRPGRGGVGVLRRRPDPGRARQDAPGAGRLDADRGPARAGPSAPQRPRRRPDPRPHRGRAGALRPARRPVGGGAAPRTARGQPQGRQADHQGRPSAHQARLRAVGPSLPRPGGLPAPLRAAVHPALERAGREGVGPQGRPATADDAPGRARAVPRSVRGAGRLRRPDWS